MDLKTKSQNKSCFDRYVFEGFIALEFLMSFTFLGYIHVPPISITVAYIPIVVAACLFGTMQASILGIIFGAISMFKASASYVMAADMIFSPTMSGKPLNSILLSVGSRLLFGFLIGVIFSLIRRYTNKRKYFVCSGIVALLAPKIHAFLVFLIMGITFPESGYNLKNAFSIGISDIAVALVCVLVTEIFYYIYHSKRVREFKNYIDDSEKDSYKSRKLKLALVVYGIVILFITSVTAIYFAQRTSYMLDMHGIKVSSGVSMDMVHLQVQFLGATIALNFICVLILISIYRYLSYTKYLGELDELTGVMGRKLFLEYCHEFHDKNKQKNLYRGWFLFFDVDYFKSVNDTFGHGAGDKVLKSVAAAIQKEFAGHGAVGRIGGDEFAAILDGDMTQEELEERLSDFLKTISVVPGIKKKITCSIGAYRFVHRYSTQTLMQKTDKLLYRAKENGRACYISEQEHIK